MAVTFADPLRYSIFSFMNTKKANNSQRVDRTERGVVAGLQLKNALSDILDMSHGKDGKITGTLNGVSNGIHTARESSKAFDAVCRGVNFASKLINPILIVASAIRAWHAEDKKSAALEEGGAMAGMLGAEYLYKRFFGLGGHSAGFKNHQWSRNLAKGFKNFTQTNKVLSKIPNNKLTVILKGLGFIAVSCGAFACGGWLGKSIADRTTAVEYAKKHGNEFAPTTNS